MRNLSCLLLSFLLYSPWSSAMTGIFWQPQFRDEAVSAANWNTLMTQLHQQGFDTLVLQWTRFGDAFSDEKKRAMLMARAAAARQAGLKLVVGLYSDPDFFTRQTQPPAALENYLNRLRQDDLLQASLWKSVQPDGWYISAEIDDLNWRDEAKRALMLKWLTDTRRQLGAIAEKPVYISSFFAGNMTPDSYRSLIAQVRHAGFNVWIQDGSGVDKLTPAVRERYLAASVSCQPSSPASGIVYEIFDLVNTQPFTAIPKPQAQITSLLNTHSPCGKARLYFSLRYLPAARGILQYTSHH